MVEVEKYEAKDKRHLHKQERYWIEELKAELNKKNPSRTEKEYYTDNKELIKEKSKEYYIDNKDKLKEKRKEYYNKNEEKLKEKRKEHYNKNKEKIKAQMKKYREDIKESIKEKSKEKIICPICSALVVKYILKNHQKTKKCLSFKTP
jgi:translation initiation factor 2B subunit (eIF-2B alpha/beta/delta family)